MELISVPVRRADELNAALASMMQERPDALLMTNDPLLQRHVGTTIDFVAEHRLPASYQAREHVVAGGLMSYGASSPELFRRGAIYVHRILQGTKPQDLPVEQPSKFEGVQPLLVESSSRSTSLFEHDLFRKPVATFRDHALAYRSFGSSASRKPSPMKFRANRVETRNRAGKTSMPVAPWMFFAPSEISTPQLVIGSCTPRPRKERKLSKRITFGTRSVT